MDNKAFVFSGMSLLMVLPAILLAASLLNMMKYAETSSTIGIAGGSVFYTCQNLIDFLQAGSVDGRRDYAIEQASVIAQSRGMNFTATNLTNVTYQIYLSMPGLTCNKTIELRRGTLIVDLNLSGWNTTINNLPVYLRRGVNSIINTTTYVVAGTMGAVTGATVNLDILNESFTGTTTAGYYRKNLNLSNYVDTTDRCTRKFFLGQHTASATASLAEWYDGSDSESFSVLGDASGSTATGYKPTRTTLGIKITMVDEYGDPVTEYFFDAPDNPNCDGNYTLPMPTINVKIYEDSIASGNLKAAYTSPTNISECQDKQPPNCEPPALDTGIYMTSSGITFTASKVYYGVVNVTSSDYLPFNFAGEISFTDAEAANVSFGPKSGNKGDQAGATDRIRLNITNIGTTDLSGYTYTTLFKYCDGSGCDVNNVSTYKFYRENSDTAPAGKRGASWIHNALNSSITLSSGNRLFANITSVGLPEIDLTNNFVNGTA